MWLKEVSGASSILHPGGLQARRGMAPGLSPTPVFPPPTQASRSHSRVGVGGTACPLTGAESSFSLIPSLHVSVPNPGKGLPPPPFYAPTHFPPTKTHWTQKWGGQPSLRSCQQDFAPQFPTPPKPLTSSGGEILHSRREAFRSLLTPTPPPLQAGGENARFVRLTWPIVQPPGARWGLHCACHTEPGTSPATKHISLQWHVPCLQGKVCYLTPAHLASSPRRMKESCLL